MLDLVTPIRSASSVTHSSGSCTVKQESTLSALARDFTFGVCSSMAASLRSL